MDATNTTGIFFTNGVLLRAIQPASLAFCGQQAIEVDKSIVFDDVHDVMAIHQHYYLVGTTNNEVIKFSPDGTELQRWVFPGENDAMHLNCLGTWGERIVFSAFGDFHHTREYKGQSVGAGFVQDLYTGERLIEGLSQPHSLLQMGDNLLVASSEDREIREYSPSGELVRSYRFDGYPRGIGILNGVIYVGLSRSRNIDDQGVSSARLVALDSHSFHELGAMDLPVREIYSVVTIEDSMQLVGAIAATASRTSFVYEQRLIGLEQQQAQWTTDIKSALGERCLPDDPTGINSVKQAMHIQAETIANLQGTVASTEAHRDTLAQQLASTEAHRDTLAQQLASTEAHRDTLVQQLTSTEAHRDTLAQQLASTEAHRDTLAQQLASTEAHRDTLVQQLTSTEAHRDTLAQQLASTEAHRDTLAQQQASTEAHRDTLAQQLTSTAAHRDTLAQQLTSTEAHRDTLVQQLTSTAAHRDTLVQQLASKEVQLESLINDVKALASSKDEIIRQHKQVVSSLEQHIASRECTLNVMGEEIASLKKQLAAKEHQFMLMGENVALLTSQLSSSEQAVNELSDEIRRQSTVLHEQERRFQFVVNSYSWQLTKPLRFLARFLRGDWQAIAESQHYLAIRHVVLLPRNVVRAGCYGVKHYGSFFRCLRAAFAVWRREGIKGLRERCRQLNQLNGR
ncbi:similar to Golgin subfamily A member 2 (Cis-Golgi matrix protein GM130) [Dickeya aquatica]|uniref:Similar to Golgin subfamily A member 2 (Cis-Golgi matrix protein GM130) n=1 Tax=Dickeya aquatica TaxID=1401087 RepID=A0A375A717_9GAMM|nr:similar to Golgin subfamily A member 2 (Cis-Golgi matrix protein GM130) [Dickeya aquatica]